MFARIDPTIVRSHVIPKRIEVERLKRSGRLEILLVVADQERSSNQMDVHFDADEPERQGIPQRRLAQVVVVRMAGEDQLTRDRDGGTRINLRPSAGTAANEERQKG